MEKKSYLKPEIKTNDIQCMPILAGSKGKDSVDNVGLTLIDNYYQLYIGSDHDITDEELWNYLTTNNSITLCADNGGTILVGTQTFTIDNGYSYTITKGTPEIDSEGNIITYYFNVDGTGQTCTMGGNPGGGRN